MAENRKDSPIIDDDARDLPATTSRLWPSMTAAEKQKIGELFERAGRRLLEEEVNRNRN